MNQSFFSSAVLWLLLFAVIIVINLFFINIREIFSLFKNIQRKNWRWLVIIFLIGLGLRFFLASHMHNLHYDEDAYLDIAKHINLNWNNCLCLYNVNGECQFCGFSFKSIGFSFFLGLFFKIFGMSSSVAFNVSSLFGSLTIIALFLLSYLLSKREDIALYSSLILALYPLHIRWSGSASAEIVSLFFIIATLLTLFIYFEISKLRFLILSILMLILSVSVKEENLLLIPFFLLFFFIKKPAKKSRYIAIILLIVLIVPFIIGNLFLQHGTTIKQELASSRYTFWKGGKILSLELLFKNIIPNFSFFIDTQHSQLFILVFFYIGIAALFVKNKKMCFVLILWILTVIALFSAFLQDSLIESDVRHYIPILVAVVIVAGYGIRFFNRIQIVRRLRGAYIVIGLLFLSFLLYIPYITSKSSPVLQAQQDYEFITSHLKYLNKDCLILTPESYVVDFYDRSALSLYLLDRFDISTCNYYYESEICYRETQKECSDMRNNYPVKLLFTNGRHSIYSLNR